MTTTTKFRWYTVGDKIDRTFMSLECTVKFDDDKILSNKIGTVAGKMKEPHQTRNLTKNSSADIKIYLKFASVLLICRWLYVHRCLE